MDYTQPQYWPQLKDLAARIDSLDYYQILNLGYEVTTGDIKRSYYQMARTLHPDKFYTVPDEALKEAIHKIYKRITEAYSILKDETKRRRYTKLVTGPDRAKQLRYDENAEAEEKKEKRENAKIAKTPQGEKSYQAAVAEIQKGNWDAAYRHIQSALLFESGNDQLKQLKDEIAAKRDG
jgi:DnaJ-class molecular chaperone